MWYFSSHSVIPLKSAEHDLSFAAWLAASLRTLPGRLLFLIDGLGEPRGAKRRGEARGLCCLFGVRRGVRGIRSHGVPIAGAMRDGVLNFGRRGSQIAGR